MATTTKQRTLSPGLKKKLATAAKAKAKPAAPVKATRPSVKATPDQLIVIELSKIKPSGTNPRTYFDETALNELADSIRIHGLAQPLLVRPEGAGVILVAGERRLRAAKLAGLKQVPCFVREMSEQEALELQIIENLQRADVTAYEEAMGYHRLVSDGRTAKEIAERIGKSPRYVWQCLGLTRLPQQAYDDMAAGTLSKSIALEIATLPSDEMRKKAIKDYRDYQGHYPTVERLRTRIEADFRRELKGAAFSKTDESLVAKAGSCMKCPKRTGNNREMFPEGRADICTDPACFESKVTAHRILGLAQLKAAGRTVIEGKAADALVGYNDAVAWDKRNQYVLADSECDADKKKRSWRDLMKAEPIMVENKRGQRIEVYALAEAIPVVEQKYKLEIEKPDPPEGTAESSAFKLRERKVKERVIALALEHLRKQAAGKKLDEIVRWALPEIIGTQDAEELITAEIFPDEEAVTPPMIAAYFAERSAKETASWLAAAVGFNDLENFVHYNHQNNVKPHSQFLDHFDLDWPALQSQAEADIAAAQEAVTNQKTAVAFALDGILDEVEAA